MRKVDELFERYGESHRNRIGQFIGHAIEGRKPSFFEDVKFLLIGPAWLLHFLYRKAGIRY